MCLGPSAGYAYEYHLKDHLGNTRVAFAPAEDGTARIVQQSGYYPYGLQMAGLGSSESGNDYLYNGKELEDELGLRWYHYGARYYDVALARWTTMDPADEFHTPYSYVGGDPVNLVDPDGRQVATAQGAGDAIGDELKGIWNFGVGLITGETWSALGRAAVGAKDLAVQTYNEPEAMLDAAVNGAVGGYDSFMAAGERGKARMVTASILFFAPTPAKIAKVGKLGRFSVLTEAPISGATRSAHRRSANRELLNMLDDDPNFSRGMDQILDANVTEHMRSGSSALRNPPGTEWHHPIGSPNVMWLLQREVHRHPSTQDILHPGPGRSGGFAEHYGNE